LLTWYPKIRTPLRTTLPPLDRCLLPHRTFPHSGVVRNFYLRGSKMYRAFLPRHKHETTAAGGFPLFQNFLVGFVKITQVIPVVARMGSNPWISGPCPLKHAYSPIPLTYTAIESFNFFDYPTVNVTRILARIAID